MVVVTSRRETCWECGYSLDGLPDALKCPECGLDLTVDPPVEIDRRLGTCSLAAGLGSLLMLFTTPLPALLHPAIGQIWPVLALMLAFWSMRAADRAERPLAISSGITEQAISTSYARFFALITIVIAVVGMAVLGLLVFG